MNVWVRMLSNCPCEPLHPATVVLDGVSDEPVATSRYVDVRPGTGIKPLSTLAHAAAAAGTMAFSPPRR